jgi:hypothetical protein
MEPTTGGTTPTPPPPPPPAAPPKKSNNAMISLVMGILGIVCCQLLAPVAWIMGKNELTAIAAGSAPAENEGLAKAGKILGIIGTILLIFSVVWIFFAGGMAFIQGMMSASGR